MFSVIVTADALSEAVVASCTVMEADVGLPDVATVPVTTPTVMVALAREMTLSAPVTVLALAIVPVR